jgi:hypothetical protein
MEFYKLTVVPYLIYGSDHVHQQKHKDHVHSKQRYVKVRTNSMAYGIWRFNAAFTRALK